MPDAPHLRAPASAPLRVLLVDDHPLFLQSLKVLLTMSGYAVVGTAGTGLEALKQARESVGERAFGTTGRQPRQGRPKRSGKPAPRPACGHSETSRRLGAEFPFN